jgi:hypothetical protein
MASSRPLATSISSTATKRRREQLLAADRFQRDIAHAADISYPLKQLGQDDAGLQACERGADAEVDAVAEGDVAIRRSPDIEAVGIGKLRLVAVGRADLGHDHLARADRSPIECYVGDGAAGPRIEEVFLSCILHLNNVPFSSRLY